MRIALVHSFYRSDAPSGENIVVLRQSEALRSAGHKVLLVARHSDEEMKTRGYSAKTALTVATGFGPSPLDELHRFQPDVVHVHNLFPNFGERWVHDWEGPLVATLHNFRPVCASGLLYRAEGVCTDCIRGNSLPALIHGCYRGSRVASIPLAIHNAGGLGRNRLLHRANRVIVLSERIRRILAGSGPWSLAQKMLVVPNGLEDRSISGANERRYWAFVGRLTPEKGVRELIQIWPAGEPLIVVGDGPQRQELEAIAHPDVTFAGVLDQAGVDEVLRSSWSLVFPSRCYEGFPTVVAEALMHGTPVVANRGNGGADFVADTRAGVVYDDDLGPALHEARAAGPEMSRLARNAYIEHLTIESWTKSLLGLYQTVTAEPIRSDGVQLHSTERGDEPK